MTLGGPVFAEWYWGPIFFAVFVGPFLLGAAAFLLSVIRSMARKRGRVLNVRQQVGIFSAIVVVGVPIAIGAVWAKEQWDKHRMFQRSAELITFQTYEPTYLPPGLEATSIWPLADPYAQSVQFDYESSTGGHLTLWQSPLKQGEYCGLDIASSTRASPVPGVCETVEIEGGATIRMTMNPEELATNTASGSFGDTGVVVAFNSVEQEEVLRLFESLQPVPADEIDYFDEDL